MSDVIYAGCEVRTEQLSPIDLRGMDFYARRLQLLQALRDLADGEGLCLLSNRAADVYWLRYEVEERMSRRYGWSLTEETLKGACTTVRLI